MKDYFARNDYREAKLFLEDAKPVGGWGDPVHSWYYYLKPDGTCWEEYERNLEGGEWDYRLQEVHNQHSIEIIQRSVAKPLTGKVQV